MTNKQILKDIVNTANYARKSGITVSVDYSLPYVDINGTGNVFFLQGEEAANLLEEAVNAGNKFNCSVEDYILYASNGW